MSRRRTRWRLQSGVVATWSGGEVWSPYKVQIFDANGSLLKECMVWQNSRCAVKASVWHIHDEVTKEFRARVVDTSNHDAFVSEVSAGVTFEPHEWQLEVTPAADMVEVDPTIGYATVGLNIEVSDSNLDAGYKVRMIDEDSGQELGAQYYVFGNPTWTKTASGNGMDHPVRHFRAEVFSRVTTSRLQAQRRRSTSTIQLQGR